MDSGLWPLIAVAAAAVIAMLAVAITLAVRLVRTRRLLRRAGLPTGRRWVFWAALAYLVLPADLVPDPFYLDDIGVLLLALRSLNSAPVARLASVHPSSNAWSRQSRQSQRKGTPPAGHH
jgi:uncharacterized membrane protein YkvA (DUF1232 family)